MGFSRDDLLRCLKFNTHEPQMLRRYGTCTDPVLDYIGHVPPARATPVSTLHARRYRNTCADPVLYNVGHVPPVCARVTSKLNFNIARTHPLCMNA